MKKKFDWFIIPTWSLIGSFVVFFVNFGIAVVLYRVIGTTGKWQSIVVDTVQFIIAAVAYIFVGLYVCRKRDRKEIAISSAILGGYLALVHLIYAIGLPDVYGILSFPERLYEPMRSWIFLFNSHNIVPAEVLYWVTVIIDIMIIMTYPLWAKKDANE